MLSLAPPVAGPGGGFLDLPIAEAKCRFTADTPVLMADGSERPIAAIRGGDRVIGRTGVNTVTGLHVVPLGRRALFGINQYPPFFTSEHPFLTPGGRRALDPTASGLETPGLRVEELTAGDVLIAATAAWGESAGALALTPAVSFSHLVLHGLRRGSGAPGDRVHNLTLDGDHSYVANGLVVHNKGGGGGGEGGQSGGGEGDQGGGGQGDGGGERDDAATTTTGTEVIETNDASAAAAPATADDTSDVFRGSAEPAGPDLTTSEEQALIANGWK